MDMAGRASFYSRFHPLPILGEDSPNSHTIAPAVADCGSVEVRFPDGRESVFFFWDDNPGRRSITLKMSQEEAEQAAKEVARAEHDKLK